MKSSPSKIEKLTSEYRQKYDLYNDFASKIASILKQVLKDEGYRFQIVTHRAKKPNSASARFEEKKCQKLDDLKDLAGCRVIFYLESDVRKFVRKVYETFGEKNIVEYNEKVSVDGYNAVHTVIHLGEDRLIHPEYKRYTNLLCDIQLTTVLHHAWSELEHDIVYKPQKELSAFDARTFNTIEEMFRKTMKEHIQPAVRDLEHIVREYEKLKNGHAVFDKAFLEQTESATTLNDMHQNLKVLLVNISEFGDKTPKEFLLTNLLSKILAKAKTLKTVPVKTIFGNFPGSNYEDVAVVILEILNVLRYWHNDKVCAICFNFLKKEKSPIILKKASEVLVNICKYDSRILRVGHLQPQLEIEKFLKSSGVLNDPKTVKVAAEMLDEVLTLSFHGTEWGYNQEKKAPEMRMTPTSLNPTPALKKLRKEAISMLKVLFSTAKTLDDKKAVITAFEQGTRWPEHDLTEKVEDMEKMLRRDINDVVSFYIKRITKEENKTVQDIEEHLVYIERGSKIKKVKIARLLKSISEMPDYQMFKVFVGHDFHFYPDLDFEKAASFRNAKIKEYVVDISEKTLPKWKKSLHMITKNYAKSKDKDSYIYFNRFLFQLGQEKPTISETLLDESCLKPFVLHLIAGIWKKNKNQAKKILKKWMQGNINLVASAAIFGYVEEIDNTLLKEITLKAIKMNDVHTLNTLANSIGRNYSGQALLKKTALEIIEALTKLKNTRWIKEVYFNKVLITKDLTQAELRIIFENLLLAEHLNHEFETLFEPIVHKYPKDFIDFLLKRVEFRKKLKSTNRHSSYDAIPNNFNRLGEVMRAHASVIIPLVIRWYSLGTPKTDQGLYRWEASRILKGVFPGNPLLEKELLKIIKGGGKKGLAIIDGFISCFEGQDFLWRLVEETINTYKRTPDYDNIERHFFGYLSQTGVVSGEYGFMEAFIIKKKALAPLKNSENQDFLDFLNNYEKYLDKRIVAEQKSSDDDIDRRRREFEN